VTAAICLHCRTALAEGSRCDGEQHVTVNLANDRAAMIEAVWGDFHHQIDALRGLRLARAREIQAPAAGIGLGLLTGAVLGMSMLPILAVTTGSVVALSAWAGRRARRSPPLHPRGALPWPPLTPFARGRVRSATGLRSPASRTECAAWALELRYEARFGARVMLRAGQTAGMDISLDNGERVRIFAGPIRLMQTLPQVADHDVAELEGWLREIDPGRAIGGELCTAIPFNVIAEDVLQVGDRVELYQAFEPAVLSGGSAALYREAPATILVPRGIASLGRVRRAQ
jgi:hypothetical protein